MPEFDKNFRKIEQSDIKSKGVVALTDRPNDPSLYGRSGLSAAELKAWFDKLSIALADRVNTIIEGTLTGDLAKKLKLSENDDMTLANFYSNFTAGTLATALLLITNAHAEGISLTAFANWVEQQVSTLNDHAKDTADSVHGISNKIGLHNVNGTAHNDIRNLISSVRKELVDNISAIEQTANSALESAAAKCKVHPMRDFYEFTYYVRNDPNRYNLGDFIVFDDKLLPDFVLFDKNATFDSAVDDYQIGETLTGDEVFEPGKSYIIGEMRFITVEGGIDYSKLVKKEEFDSAVERIGAIEQTIPEISNDVNLLKETTQSLSEMQTELGNAIPDQINSHNSNSNAHKDIRAEIDSKIATHNNSEEPHPALQEGIDYATSRAEAAFNLATGHSSVISIKTANAIVNHLIYNDALVIGDLFLVEDSSSPDFSYLGVPTVDEIALAREEGRLYTASDFVWGTAAFEIDTLYIIEGKKLRSSSRDIDLTALAQKQEVRALEDETAKLKSSVATLTKENTTLKEKISELEIEEVETSSETVLLEHRTKYKLGLRTSIVLQLPEEVPEEFECYFHFRSGDVATMFDSPENIYYTQDDCWAGVLTPCKNRIYEVSIAKVEGFLIAKVGCADAVVIGE